jgi:hypothetical protein
MLSGNSVHILFVRCYQYCTGVVVRREHFYAITLRSAVCLLSVWKSEVVSFMALRSAKPTLPRWLSHAAQSAKFLELHTFQVYF